MGILKYIIIATSIVIIIPTIILAKAVDNMSNYMDDSFRWG